MTFYALSSGPGLSGIAVIRVSGSETVNVIKHLTNSSLPKPKEATLKKFIKVAYTLSSIVFNIINEWSSKKVQLFCKKNNLSNSIEHRVLDIVSEIGELSKEILKASNYVKSSYVSNEKIKLELGDVLFSLITLANSLDVNLDVALEMVLKKYEKRIEEGLTPDSDN